MKKNWFWFIVAILLAYLSIYFVSQQSKGLSFGMLKENFRNSSAFWMIIALVCMFCFIFFEGAAIICVLRSLGYRKDSKSGILYSAADIFFSAITPSSTGGQPASIYFMIRGGIPGSIATIVLLINLVMYTLSIIIIGFLSIMMRSGLFAKLTIFSKILLVLSSIVLIGLVALLYLLIKRRQILHGIGNKLIALLATVHIIKHTERLKKRFSVSMDSYEEAANMIKGQNKMLWKVFLLNIAQRVSQISVAMMVFLATGGSPGKAGDIWIAQSYVTLGSNLVPVPGSMGIADYMMLDSFSKIVPNDFAVQLELISRSIAFYSCVIISGIIIFIGYLYRGKGDK